MKKILMIILAMMISLTSLPLYVFANDVSETAESQIAEQNEAIITDSADEPVAYAAASSSGGQWVQESNGRWWYKHADGSYTKYDWEYINGNWYFFDKNGWMWTDWLEWKGSWYYLDLNSGKMHTGWSYINGEWYYFKSNGAMNVLPITIDGIIYDFYNDENFRYGQLRETLISLIRQEQEKSHWCWAACAVMAGTYKTSSKKTQTDVAKHIFNGSVINIGIEINKTRDAFEFASEYSKSGKVIEKEDITFNNLVSLIDANHPFILRVKWSEYSGHVLVGTGYERHLGEVFLVDPSEENNSKYYDYKKLMSGITIGKKTGSCTAIISY